MVNPQRNGGGEITTRPPKQNRREDRELRSLSETLLHHASIADEANGTEEKRERERKRIHSFRQKNFMKKKLSTVLR